MSTSPDATKALSAAQRRLLEDFYSGRLSAGKLMEALRRAGEPR